MTMDSFQCHEMSKLNEMKRIKGIVVRNLITKLETKWKAYGFRQFRANNLMVSRDLEHLKAESISFEQDLRYKAKLL